jgi:DNA-binding HxlR family transcriptional regulator
MNTLGSKWKPIIVMVIGNKKLRFGQIATIIGIISRKVLTDELRELERDNIVIRKEFKELLPRVEYRLTEKRFALMPVLKLLEKWERTHAPQEK